ncbi:MAG: hypothetical protein R3F53_16400 [Gammaproteobacteria bacterium]
MPRPIPRRPGKIFDDTTLLAPFDGLVAVKHVNNYENVQAKQTIIELEAIVSIEITVDVPEEVMAGTKQIPLGQEVGAVISNRCRTAAFRCNWRKSPPVLIPIPRPTALRCA